MEAGWLATRNFDCVKTNIQTWFEIQVNDEGSEDPESHYGITRQVKDLAGP
ncbi:hypothetical protein [Verminephrobacter aporrectodeae]|uniref:hypothetical protein n=1 Tax=Verminephrobacter aporrectodeae TaxID=1110389 RepID=UPI0002E06A0D|nr:hypothetical protein [Verminephrobacter aporrectodeae]